MSESDSDSRTDNRKSDPAYYVKVQVWETDKKTRTAGSSLATVVKKVISGKNKSKTIPIGGKGKMGD